MPIRLNLYVNFHFYIIYERREGRRVAAPVRVMFNAPVTFVKKITGEGESWERFFNSVKNLDPRKEWLEACNVSFFSLHGTTRRRRMTMMKAMATIYTWRLHKQIYSFDETLERLLCEETDQTMIPVEVLHRLPKSFYVATKTFCDMDGFFVSVVDGQGEEDVTIYLVILFTSGEFGFVSCTFSQNCNSLSDISIQAEESAKQFSSAEQVFKLLQLVLYVASDRKVTKRVSSEVVVYNVGELSQSAYRKTKGFAEEEKFGTRKKPHYRKAHWHTYWIGPRGRNRKMILRWNPPVYVNYHEKAGEARCVIEEIEA